MLKFMFFVIQKLVLILLRRDKLPLQGNRRRSTLRNFYQKERFFPMRFEEKIQNEEERAPESKSLSYNFNRKIKSSKFDYFMMNGQA